MYNRYYPLSYATDLVCRCGGEGVVVVSLGDEAGRGGVGGKGERERRKR